MPELSSRRFGIEFEFTNAHSANYYGRRIAPVIAARGRTQPLLVTERYQHSAGTRWEIKPDSTCGWELVSPVLRWSDWGEVTDVLHTLEGSGAVVTNTCGLHVHHECRDFSPRHARRVVMLWMLFEDIMFGAVGESRANNEYCVPVRNNVGDLQTFLWQSRQREYFRRMCEEHLGHYTAVNLDRWWRMGVMEFRIHHGTLNIEDTRRWVLLTQSFVELAKQRSWRQLVERFETATPARKLQLLQAMLRRYYAHPEVQQLPEGVRESIRRYHPELLAGV